MLKRSPIIYSKLSHSVHMEEVNEFVAHVYGDIAYEDPPYTKRQYGAYYHILETIAIGDEPEITGHRFTSLGGKILRLLL